MPEESTLPSDAARVVVLASYIVWFGGMFRLIGEIAGPFAGQVVPITERDRNIWLFSVALVLLLTLGVWAAIWRWPPGRATLLQTRADVRSIYGLPPEDSGEIRSNIGRAVGISLVVAIPALVIAVLLPGIVAAAVAMVIAMVLRVAVVVAAGRA